MLIDFQVIDQHAPRDGALLQVLADRSEVVFRDASALHLHRVCTDNTLDTFLRAMHHDGFTWVVFDVRQMSPELEADILGHHAVDANGLIYYTLRLAFTDARACQLAAVQQATASWWRSPQLELEFAS